MSADAMLMTAAPELEIGKQLAPYTPAIMMGPLITFAVILIIIGVTVTTTSQTNKTAGVLLLIFGSLMGAGALYIVGRVGSARR